MKCCVFLVFAFVLAGPRCNKALGMTNGRIRNSQITSSSRWDNNHGPFLARLNAKRTGRFMGAWAARRNDHYQWLQVNFGRATRVTQIATRGRQDARQWVKSYYLSYSQDGVKYVWFMKNSARLVRHCSTVLQILLQASQVP